MNSAIAEATLIEGQGHLLLDWFSKNNGGLFSYEAKQGTLIE